MQLHGHVRVVRPHRETRSAFPGFVCALVAYIYVMQHGWDRSRRLYTKKTANVQLKARNENLYAHACVERTASNLSVLGVEHTGDPGLSGHP